MSYFVQKKCEQLPGGQAVQQIIKLTNSAHSLALQQAQQVPGQPLSQLNVHQFAVGTKGSGLFIMDINLTTYETTREEHVFLQGKYITDILELKEGLLLVASYSDCSYYMVDLAAQKEELLCKGFSPYAMGLSKFPDFAFAGETPFPYVLAKEDDYLAVLNVRTGFAFRLAHVPTHNQNHFSQRLAFTSERTFVTDEGSYYLAKYRLSDLLFKYLREIQAWAVVNKMIRL